ncbi:alcohol dehydrogenase catalytic domain-containing protein [Methylomonas rosea]|uniref:Alcohol dehydrogenase catalytic domain-containing protein n=1 Tax=Methylomonas rosea TaxID=2952227 RepID=A0ABT1TP06_9GAMM|nr:alcohol dehydrogenase catalytic domain-containing protein [Methylomonas sp. WSC-7]MCQ8116504.1 alcohol dehydrogenase catalytic domain-containing protein [Methylomonas sp. WSC-7]
MQALTLDKLLSYRNDISIPDVAAGGALIKLRLAGICATDLELVQGYAGFSGILGHEFVGTVIAVNDDKHRDWLNRRVVGSINIGCNSCEVCRSDGPEHCLNRKVLGIRGKDGVFADYFSLPVTNLYAVPDAVPDQAAVFTEPLAAALRVVKQIASLPITEVAVVGPGRLGMLIAKVLSLIGYRVTVLGRSTSSLALPKQWQLATGLTTEIPDNCFDCVVDASGQAAGFAQALRIVKPRGTLVLKSTFAANAALDLSKVVVYEINIIGSRCGPFADALTLLAQNKLPVETMIDGQYPLSEGLAAFAHAAQAGVRKILLQSAKLPADCPVETG